MKKWIKKLVLAGSLFIIVCFFVVWYADCKITNDTQYLVYDEVESIPSKNVALVLGTAKRLRGGKSNLYFTYRIEAAKKLYSAGKVKAFVLSGDNRFANYNEPQDMKEALIDAGIPDSIIYLDYAGLRTLDSVVRMNKIFGQNDFIIVSQKFHNERAVYLAKNYNHTVHAYNAKDLSFNRYSIKTVIREKLARVKVFIDLLLHTKPEYGGKPVFIKISQNKN